jgi:hypothetical protein
MRIPRRLVAAAVFALALWVAPSAAQADCGGPVYLPPQAAFTYVAQPGGVVDFDGTSLPSTTETYLGEPDCFPVHNDDAITSYKWEFGDGMVVTNPAPTETVSHTYPAAGDYDATLTVTTNGFHTNMDSYTATVTATAPPSGGGGGSTPVTPAPIVTASPPFDLAAAIKKCRKRFKGNTNSRKTKRNNCIKNARKHAGSQ